MKLKFNIIVILFLVVFDISAQTEPKIKKPNFVVKTDNPTISIDKYENALDNYGKLDEFRFYNKRRTIRFQNCSVSVELYSAKELFDQYGKVVSVFTIKDNQPYKEIEFALTADEKNIKPQLK